MDDRIIRTVAICHFIDLFFSDPFFVKYSEIEEEYIDVLSAFEDEGPYQFDAVFLEEGDVLIDAGSNMGVFALLSAKYHGCKVHAFEPGTEGLTYLKKNIELNNLSNLIKIYPLGLSNSNNTVNFQINSNALGASTIMPDMMQATKTNGIRNEVIHCVSLDSWVKENNIQKIDFIKADIEGAERLMLQGATRS